MGEVAIGCGDNTDVNTNRPRAAKPFEFLFLKHPQQFRLQVQGQFTDLVEKKGPTVGELEAAGRLIQGASECAALVSKDFAFQ